MKIYRDFLSNKPGEGTCRVEITLTEKELVEAFNECQHNYDLADVDYFLREYREETTLSEEEIEAVSKDYSEYRECLVDDNWYENMLYAIEEVMKRRNES